MSAKMSPTATKFADTVISGSSIAIMHIANTYGLGQFSKQKHWYRNTKKSEKKGTNK